MTTAQRSRTAAVLLTRGQWVVGAVLIGLVLLDLRFFGPMGLLRTATGSAVLFFFVVVTLLKLLPWWKARNSDPLVDIPTSQLDDWNLPTYDIFVPMRNEGEVVRRLVRAMKALRYPVEKLRIFLLVDDDDDETIAAVGALGLGAPFEMVQVPRIKGSHGKVLERNKPAALDFGYTYVMDQRGGLADLIAVYDAEDAPDPGQLYEAVLRYGLEDDRGSNVGCLQARLSFWNPRRSWLSTFYWAEYAVHFNWVLAGLSRLGWILPLGGTSNHFLRAAYETVAKTNGPWGYYDRDNVRVQVYGPFDLGNVTEDADLGARLCKNGFGIAMLNSSVTYEEAPKSWGMALWKQRSRWAKGYIQCFLVHSRTPLQTIRKIGLVRYLVYNLFMIGTPLAYMISPLVWGMTLLYPTARLMHLSSVSMFIEGLFPTPIYLLGMMLGIFGNLLLLYQMVVVPAAQQEAAEAVSASERYPLADSQATDEYGLSFRLLFIPLWWALMWIPSCKAVVELAIPSLRARWAGSDHGHDQEREQELLEQTA